MENSVAVTDNNETSDLSVVEKKWLSDEEKLEDDDGEVIISNVVNWYVTCFYKYLMCQNLFPMGFVSIL